jgi:glutamine synthetase
VKDAPKLPLNLLDAIRWFDADEELKQMLGTEFSASYVKMKMQEWTDYMTHFSQWERDNTLDI